MFSLTTLRAPLGAWWNRVASGKENGTHPGMVGVPLGLDGLPYRALPPVAGECGGWWSTGFACGLLFSNGGGPTAFLEASPLVPPGSVWMHGAREASPDLLALPLPVVTAVLFKVPQPPLPGSTTMGKGAGDGFSPGNTTSAPLTAGV